MSKIGPWLLRGALLAAGSFWLMASALAAFGGYERLWLFTRLDQNRFQAMAMLTGTLRLRSSLALLWNDEQVFNGGVYTNWGFGVPLLQAPFHAFAAKWLEQKFFPDRAIYFAYLTATIAYLWAALHRLCSMRDPSGPWPRRTILSCAATGLVLACAVCPLMSCRFLIYEETICYLMLCEFAALGGYIFALRRWSLPAVCAMGVASGFGLLVRPTGLFYLVTWGAMTAIESRSKKAKLAFTLTVTPFVAFWMYSNWVKGGSPLTLGLSNQALNNVAQTAVMRFGNHCADSPGHIANVAQRLFLALFVSVPQTQPEWLNSCHFFGFEERPPAAHEPFLGVSVAAILIWISAWLVARRENRLALYAPLAGLALLFASYLYAGAGLAWRYVGDFWPFILLACVQYVRSNPAPMNKRGDIPLAMVFVACALGDHWRSIEPWQPEGYYRDQWETLSTADATSMWDRFTTSRSSRDKPLPPQVHCGDRFDGPLGNMQGWSSSCDVGDIANVYLGVPKKSANSAYELRLVTDGMTAATLRVYVNGRIYTAQRAGAVYTARVEISYLKLISPIVIATVEWPQNQASAGKLISIELT